MPAIFNKNQARFSLNYLIVSNVWRILQQFFGKREM